jgi:hypothetical protein
MKINLNSPAVLIVLLLVFASCEEVVQLDLKNSASRVVIDALINASTGDCVVKVSKSLDFYQVDSFAKIEGAAVELFQSSGAGRKLSEMEPGIYSANNLMVRPGETFKLNIVLSPDETYTAQTIAPMEVFLDSLKVVRGFGDPRPTSPPVYLINPKWKDPKGIANFYRFKVTKNGKQRQGSFNITSDEPFDGTDVDMPLYRYDFELGDTVKLEFQSIDSVSYSYYNQINDMARPSFVSATPYNPIGNFDNNALGFFGVYYAEIRDLIISPRH